MSLEEGVGIVVLLSLSALFSGLTLGLLGVSLHEVRRKARLGDPNARRVWSVRKEGSRLLTSLLLGNVLVNAALSVLLGSLMAGVAAATVATGLIVVFGEILPQAAFHRLGLPLSARFVPLVRLLLFLTAPVAKPIAWALDRMLGHELPSVYSRNELIELIAEHEDSAHSDIDADEERIIKGALTFSHKRAGEIMTPWPQVVSLRAEDALSPETLSRICRSGFSRFPLMGEGGAVAGIVHLHDIVCALAQGKDDRPFSIIASLPVRFVGTTTPLDTILAELLRSREHMRIVCNREGDIVGIITLEDILEEILDHEILDEREGKHSATSRV
ncbi:MAG: hypothetical protein KatS3mg099_110 [Candidatus Parcubacteria bacterium]|nr:MAG: hypothetical protein KatS3mg099_110 [Candidatus Parcubacteria bacterium]